jgi:1-acyl-sn-glycerol-3-phosphate acyltransferase
MSLAQTWLSHLKGTVVGAAIGTNTVVLTTVLCLLSVFKFLTPAGAIRNNVRRYLAKLAELWISVNHVIMSVYRGMQWNIEIPEGLNAKGCYLVNSNHQSWVDILVLQKAFNQRLPFLRFFLKQQLIWVPFLGIAWWALDMPFMRRHSRGAVSRNPGLKNQDLENARLACEKFRGIPVSMMNFLEGTRFSKAKRDAQKSRWQNLLKPRIGGIAQVLFALGDQLDSMMDVTIVYPDGAPTFWEYISGRVRRIEVRARKLQIPQSLRGKNFRTDPAFRKELEAWVSAIWDDKDRAIDNILGDATPIRT